MEVTLKAYLLRLEAEELSRPASERRPVPTLRELAAAVGLHETTLSTIANQRKKTVALDQFGRIIAEFRRRGFRCDVNDLLMYREG